MDDFSAYRRSRSRFFSSLWWRFWARRALRCSVRANLSSWRSTAALAAPAGTVSFFHAQRMALTILWRREVAARRASSLSRNVTALAQQRRPAAASRGHSQPERRRSESDVGLGGAGLRGGNGLSLRGRAIRPEGAPLDSHPMVSQVDGDSKAGEEPGHLPSWGKPLPAAASATPVRNCHSESGSDKMSHINLVRFELVA